MAALPDHPSALFLLSLVTFWLFGLGGRYAKRFLPSLRHDEQDEYKIVEGACLTLLGLIIGFCFAMSISRYDLRKTMEEAEANAIGTEWTRAELLPAPAESKLKGLLKAYADLRIAFYTGQDQIRLAQVQAEEAKLQSDMWSIARDAAAAQPTPIVALVVAGANDVLNAQGYTLAAWRNRIPAGAWALMAIIAAACSWMLGFGSQRFNPFLLLVVPATISVSFLLIAEIDSPHGGFIRVLPINLITVAESLKSP